MSFRGTFLIVQSSLLSLDSEVLSSSDVAVTATAGHNVTLPCRSSSYKFGVDFCWGRGECPFTGRCGSNEIYKGDGRVHRMSDKYQLTGDIQRGDLSLTVVNVTMEDGGPYCCLIEISGLFNDEKNSMWLRIFALISRLCSLSDILQARGLHSNCTPPIRHPGAGFTSS
uniref:Ig-like domain-containing protein n=1 Tax=Erpetoichthys calabaricus TaxID=27687 RepID=A0A8C4SXF6_ERPCA